MSNGGFDGLTAKLLEKMKARAVREKMMSIGPEVGSRIGSMLAVAVRPATATIRYSVSFDHPEKHLFHVTMTIPVEARSDTVVAMPAWNALYQVRDFAMRIRDVKAICNSSTRTPVQVRQLDKDTWRVGPVCSLRAGWQERFRNQLFDSMGRCWSIQLAIERAPRLHQSRRDPDVCARSPC